MNRTLYRLVTQAVVMLAMMITSLSVMAQDTFSIVAIDLSTNEVGSAGASCVGSSTYYPHGAAILSDVLPGIGAIHTQAAYLQGNQANAHARMLEGMSPQEIIDWLINNDVGGNPTTRQYSIVDLNGGDPRSAAYSGVNCLDYKNDTAGYTYSIQGNILLGQQIIDSMQSRFLSTEGTLAERLMAALQGAKVIGADTRCAAPFESSSLSAFLRVAQPDDAYDSLYLDLWMAYPQTWSTVVPLDPIDSLQVLFNDWQITTSIHDMDKDLHLPVRIKYLDAGDVLFDFSACPPDLDLTITLYNVDGKTLSAIPVTSSTCSINPSTINTSGMYIYRVSSGNSRLFASGKLFLR